MLELRNIVKDYVSGNNVTHALRGISVNFRTNEFVSILGPSGCGKTTTLNIIGGLDRYTEGDLLINGKSTKEYTDRDWDTYRNHSIGFVFQTYNLIAHQTILKNVELALTISGVDKEERERRSYEALKIVGLEGMEKKKPNQLSGGQCQRVAIARALVNNPEILLADEPTGALDSETSVQIMELLKEVAQNRLVIMVTHNPDLANAYSTRIIRMVDGLLTDDSNPFNGVENIEKSQEISENSQEKPEISKGKKKQSSMSILTAIGLSTSNLLSKMKRTVLVTIAGSIGIIGVSAVLGVSRGVKDYIKDLQTDMLSSYPLTVAEESVDYSKLMTGLNNQEVKDKFEFDPKNPKVGVDSMISYLMSAYGDVTNVKTNTIDDKLMTFIRGIVKEEKIVTRENYAIDPTNNIFGKWKDQATGTQNYYSFNGLTQRYIAELKTVNGFGEYATFVDLFTSFMHELPANDEYVTNQYDVIAGEYSTNEDDLVLVVDKETTLTDVLLAQMGVFDHDSFLNIAKCAMEEQKVKKEGYDGKSWESFSPEDQDKIIKEIRDEFPYKRSFKYSDLLKRDFYYYPQDSIYAEDPEVAPKSTNLILNFHGNNGTDIYGSLTYQELMGYGILNGSIMRQEGSTFVINNVICVGLKTFDDSLVVREKSDLAGVWYVFDQSNQTDLINALASFDTEILDLAKYTLDIKNGGDTIEITKKDEPDPKPKWTDNAPDWPHVDPPEEVTNYSYSAIADESWINDPSSKDGMKMKISAILRLKENKQFGSLSRGLYYPKKFGDKFIEDSKDAKVTTALKSHINNSITYNTQFDQAFVYFPYQDHKYAPTVVVQPKKYASTLNGDLSSSFSDIFASFMGTDQSEANAVHLRSLSGYKSVLHFDDADNFINASFEYLPREIEFFPESFEQKNQLTKRLDEWNEEKTLTIDNVKYRRADRDELSYSDTISLIAAVIDTFIDAITIALVVFTSLSLVVSCFMIAVITYISVVERIKEIGVIRSLGGRKRDVANLFIMETLMTGLFSGVFGVAITYILEVIINIILKALFGLTIMNLTIPTALIMITVSVVLSILSGLLPSQSAAHKDPVVALRSNE